MKIFKRRSSGFHFSQRIFRRKNSLNRHQAQQSLLNRREEKRFGSYNCRSWSFDFDFLKFNDGITETFHLSSCVKIRKNLLSAFSSRNITKAAKLFQLFTLKKKKVFVREPESRIFSSFFTMKTKRTSKTQQRFAIVWRSKPRLACCVEAEAILR